MTTFLTVAAITLATLFNPSEPKQKIDDGWQFRLTLDDKGKQLDNAWTTVDLPHDWSILNDFDKNASPGNDGAYLPAGAGVYRKEITVGLGQLKDMNVDLYLEGAYMNAQVKVNDSIVGTRPYGYSSVIYPVTSCLREGTNTIEIAVDNSRQKNCRWYSGSGLYRHVWLLNSPKVHVRPWSLFITTPQVGRDKASVNVTFDLAGGSSDIRASVKRPDGQMLPVAEGNFHAGKGSFSFIIERPELWSPETPALYELHLDVGKQHVVETFGIRSIAYSAEKGFLLNGKPVVFNGGCVHHDNGMLGARSYDAAEARKVRLLKEAGFNAVRTSHNPPSPAFLDECDRQGLVVIDESFDGWRKAKTPGDYSVYFDAWWQKDIESMVLRDRNHPSIICWSIGNEVIERKEIEVVTTAKKLADLCHKLDPTRPVTSALCSWDKDWEIYDPLAAQHDIVGYNYMMYKAESDHERVPSRIIWQTESYPRDAFANWTKVNDLPYVIGDFVWTAMDYLGESGIGRHYYKGESEGEHYHRNQFPWHASFCGDIDLLGHRKPISHYRELLYTPASTDVYVAVREPNGYFGEIKETLWGTYPTWESWTWPGHEGKPIEVEVISRAHSVRLYLDDEAVGEARTGREQAFKAVFTLPYRPGTLKAVALDEAAKEVAVSNHIHTAGKPVAVRLSADKTILKADNQDLLFVTAEVVDAKGNVVPTADGEITFSVSGKGTLEAAGSADIKDTVGYHRPVHKAWKGRAGAVVKATRKAGKIKVIATSPSLRGAFLNVVSKEAQ